jgi:hypothetical protein
LPKQADAARAPRRVRVVDAGGEASARRRLGRTLLSIVGRVSVERLVYQAEGAAALFPLFPLDAALDIPLCSHAARGRGRGARLLSAVQILALGETATGEPFLVMQQSTGDALTEQMRHDRRPHPSPLTHRRRHRARRRPRPARRATSRSSTATSSPQPSSSTAIPTPRTTSSTSSTSA